MDISLDNARKQTVVFILPHMPRVLFGGYETTLLFACLLREEGINVKIHSCQQDLTSGSHDLSQLERAWPVDMKTIKEVFASLSTGKLILGSEDTVVCHDWIISEKILKFRESINAKKIQIMWLAQDFECLFANASDTYARIQNTYKKVDYLIVNSESLAKFLRHEEGLHIDENLVIETQHLFKGSISKSKNNDFGKSAPLRVVLYGRPNTPRNLFPMAIRGLMKLIEGDIPEHIEFLSVGEMHENINLGKGHLLESRGALSHIEYEQILESAQIGIGLMFSPHPSYPPLEMLEKGLITITNDYKGCKKPYLTHSNLILIDPNDESLVFALRDALDRIKSSSIAIPLVKNKPFGLPIKDVATNVRDIIIKS